MRTLAEKNPSADIKANATLKVRLFKNNLTPGNSSVLADFTEADFSGYTATEGIKSLVGAGARGFLRKPYSTRQLLEAMQRALKD